MIPNSLFFKAKHACDTLDFLHNFHPSMPICYFLFKDRIHTQKHTLDLQSWGTNKYKEIKKNYILIKTSFKSVDAGAPKTGRQCSVQVKM